MKHILTKIYYALVALIAMVFIVPNPLGFYRFLLVILQPPQGYIVLFLVFGEFFIPEKEGVCQT